jgi:hypothetical protein
MATQSNLKIMKNEDKPWQETQGSRKMKQYVGDLMRNKQFPFSAQPK